MTPSTFLNLFVTLAAVASAVFAFVQAKSATDSRRDAQDAGVEAIEARNLAKVAQVEAQRVAIEARDALSRSATALERANELSEAALPKVEVRWRVESTKRKGHYIAINEGTIPARDVVLSGEQGILIDGESPVIQVGPGDGCEFSSWQGNGMASPLLSIRWIDSRSPESQEIKLAVRL